VDGTDEFGGSPAGGDSIEINGVNLIPLSDLTPQSSSVSGNTAQGTFTGTVFGVNFSIGVQYILLGGSSGSGSSSIDEIITLKDLGAPPIPPNPPLDFIPVVDTFDANLNATPNNDTLTLSPSDAPTTAVQTDPTGVKLTYTGFPSGLALISNGISGTGVGPSTGNEAFQADWYISLYPGDSTTISNTISLSGQGSTAVGVPLPNSAAIALATLTGLGTVAIIRRKRAKV